jgi:hypothetical protein
MPFAYLIFALLSFFQGHVWLGCTLLVFAVGSFAISSAPPFRVRPKRAIQLATLSSIALGLVLVASGFFVRAGALVVAGLILVATVEVFVAWLSWRNWRDQAMLSSSRAS